MNTYKCTIRFNSVDRILTGVERIGTTSTGKKIHYFDTNIGIWTPTELLHYFGTYEITYEGV
jgi:hypothetical protein